MRLPKCLNPFLLILLFVGLFSLTGCGGAASGDDIDSQNFYYVPTVSTIANLRIELGGGAVIQLDGSPLSAPGSAFVSGGFFYQENSDPNVAVQGGTLSGLRYEYQILDNHNARFRFFGLNDKDGSDKLFSGEFLDFNDAAVLEFRTKNSQTDFIDSLVEVQVFAQQSSLSNVSAEYNDSVELKTQFGGLVSASSTASPTDPGGAVISSLSNSRIIFSITHQGGGDTYAFPRITGQGGTNDSDPFSLAPFDLIPTVTVGTVYGFPIQSQVIEYQITATPNQALARYTGDLLYRNMDLGSFASHEITAVVDTTQFTQGGAVYETISNIHAVYDVGVSSSGQQTARLTFGNRAVFGILPLDRQHLVRAELTFTSPNGGVVDWYYYNASPTDYFWENILGVSETSRILSANRRFSSGLFLIESN